MNPWESDKALRERNDHRDGKTQNVFQKKIGCAE